MESEICTDHFYTNYLFLMVFLFVSISRVPKDRQFLVLRFNYCCSYAHLNFTWYLRNTNSNYDVFVLFFSFLVFMAFAGSFSPVQLTPCTFMRPLFSSTFFDELSFNMICYTQFLELKGKDLSHHMFAL